MIISEFKNFLNGQKCVNCNSQLFLNEEIPANRFGQFIKFFNKPFQEYVKKFDIHCF